MAQNISPLKHHLLLERGCKLWFASSKKAAIDLLEGHSFHLMLTEFMLPDGTAFHFIPALLGTNATMFFSTAVEELFVDDCGYPGKRLFGGTSNAASGIHRSARQNPL